MFKDSYKKFYSLLVISVFLGLGSISILLPGGATGYATSEMTSQVFNWPIFFAGIAVGVLITGAILYTLKN